MALKVELHSHTSDDPHDLIPHDAYQLIDRAAERGYQALAITLHDHQLDVAPFSTYARSRGVTLIPGIERTISGKHVLLINFSRGGTESVRTFEDLRRLRTRERGLVIAPHPFFPSRCCLHSLADRHRDLFDAVEYNAMFTSTVNFNARAERWAARRGLPMVGNGDVHRLEQLDTTWSLVDADPEPDAICAAIRAGQVRVEKRPHSWSTVASILSDMAASDLRRGGHRIRRRLRLRPATT